MFPVAILAGGLATRLRPITETIPKSLIEIAGKPFIHHQLAYLQRQGVTSVVLCIGYLGEMVKRVVGDGSDWGIKVDYSLDGPTLLGTGGALKQALPLLGEQFFVLYGDSYLPIDFFAVQNAFISSKKLGLMTVFENQNSWDKSNVEFYNGQILEHSKINIRSDMHHIDYGLGLLRSAALESYTQNQLFDLSNLYNKLSLAGHLAGFEVFERFYEIGSLQGICDAQAYFLQQPTNGTL
jgi:NDP-sugar pyrophosphorylase family protein